VRRIASTFPLLCLLFAWPASAQQWSGIITPTRAINWSNAGIPGGIPNRTTQCGATIAGYSGSASTINSAIANCPAGQFVSLGAGTFNLSSGIAFGQHNNVTLRGQGANSTFLVFTGAGAGFYNADVSLEGAFNENDGFENNVCDWTAGYAPGTTVITLANCGSTIPAKGSLSNLKVGSILILDQDDETLDTGTIWNCAIVNVCANTIQSGFQRQDGPIVSGMAVRSQQQGVRVVAISGNQVTITPGLYMPNWRNSQAPQAWFDTSIATGMGLENLSIDNTGSPSTETVMVANCDQCWVKGIRSIYANRSHVRLYLDTRFVVRDSYFYENKSHQTVSYGAEIADSFDGLIENNIFQQDTDSEPSCSGSCAGDVISYNFDIDNVYGTAGWFQAGYYQHSSGDVFNLWEGNIGPGYTADQVHGTHHFETLFRNYLIGNQSAGCGGAGVNTCTANTIPINAYSGSRYFNIIGNVLGQQGYHTKYWCNASNTSSCTNGIYAIFATGFTNNNASPLGSILGYCGDPSCSTRGDFDPQTGSYLLRWGNYDVVTGAARWCGSSSDTGWSTTCASTSEIPTGIAQFANTVPSVGDTSAGQPALPASFYYSSKPSWWPSSKPWPAIGPDVSGGNITGLGGHANTNPAQDCYTNVMGGPAAGTGAVLNFDARACYGTSVSQAPAPPTNLNAIVH